MGSISFILEDLGNNKYILECAYCKGTGQRSRDHDGRAPWVICPVCNGRGKTLIELNGSLPFGRCAYCNGTGQRSRDQDGRAPWVVCQACHGVGVLPITGEIKILR